MNRWPIILIIAAILAFLGLNSYYVINPREQAIVLRFGKIRQVETTPGIYFKMPFAFMGLDKVELIDHRLMRLDLADITVQVSGGKFYEVDAFLVYRVADPARFMGQVSGSTILADERLKTRFDAALRRVYGQRGFEAALSSERLAMMKEVADQLRPAAVELGLNITDVRIRRTDLTKEVSEQTYNRMNAERLAEAELLRARGQEAARRIRAKADRLVVETKADAQRQSEIARGEGEAAQNAIFADAYNRDKDFFEFYRSMTAYTKALQSTGTTMVLSPDSDFFKYFGKADGTSSKAQ